jgi:hypothetical protein
MDCHCQIVDIFKFLWHNVWFSKRPFQWALDGVMGHMGHMGHTRRWTGRLRGQLNPLAATLPPCPVAMVLMHKSQALVRQALMEAQARLLGFSTIFEISITPALMATRAINASALLVFSLCGKCYMGHLGPKPNIILLILLRDSACSTDFSTFLVPCATMP